ncbi:hypothetical protein V8E52_006675 [Russula decolorans]
MTSKPQGAPFASWVTAWFNLLGQAAVTTTIGANYKPNSHKAIGIYAATQNKPDASTINTFGVRILKYLNNVSVWWYALGTASLAIAILAAAPKHQSGKFVFRTFINGYDVSAYMTEETHNAAISGPIGIIKAIGVSAILGWFFILSLLFSVQDYRTTIASLTGQPVTQIFLDTVEKKGAIVLMMMYAFTGDGGIPGSKFLCKVDRRWRSPIHTGFLTGILGSSVAFSAATSTATTTIEVNISYGIPIALRVIYADRFIRRQFHLARFSYPIAIAAVLWIAFISIVFCLPELNPVNSQTLNYVPVAVGIVLTYALGNGRDEMRKR